MKKRIQLAVILMIVTTFLFACSTKDTANYQKQDKMDTDFFTAQEKEEMGITDKTSIEIYSNPNLINQYFVKVVTEVDWFEGLYRVTVKENKKTIEAMQDGIVDDVTFYTQGNGLELPNKYIPILLAVTTSTHMGNGDTTFYAFTKDGTMDLLLSAGHTVDREKDTTDGSVFENGRLFGYMEKNNSGSEYSDIAFIGRVYMYGVKNNDLGEYLYQIKDIEKVYSFNKEISQYEETSSKEDVIQTVKGVSSFSDYWKEQLKSDSEN